MKYFQWLKKETIDTFSLLLEDIDIIKGRAELPKNKKSINLLERYIQNAFLDIKTLEDPTLFNWQMLAYTILQEERYETFVSNLICRFGSITPYFEETYSALDKFSDEIVDSAGVGEVSSFPTLIMCGGDPYTTIVGMNQICLKSTDIQHCFNWGILGHEIGHDVIRKYFPQLTATPRTRQRRVTMKKPPTYREILASWQQEILCDIFGTLVVGPSLLSGHMMAPRIWCLAPMEEISILEFFSTHPPDEVRFKIMYHILDQMGLKNNLDISDIVDLPKNIIIDDDAEELEIFKTRIKDIKQLTPLFLDWVKGELPSLSKNIVNVFTLENWNRSCEISNFLIGKTDDLPENPKAIEVINGLAKIRLGDESIANNRDLMKRVLLAFRKI